MEFKRGSEPETHDTLGARGSPESGCLNTVPLLPFRTHPGLCFDRKGKYAASTKSSTRLENRQVRGNNFLRKTFHLSLHGRLGAEVGSGSLPE